MKYTFLLMVFVGFILAGCSDQSPTFSAEEVTAWEARAANVTITRDDWGIPHIKGNTDADAVFGMIYSQAEDDFNRIEVNFLNALGRLAEAEGEAEVYRDLRMRLFIDENELKAMFDESPDWLKDLMIAWADGLNFYLHSHPDVQPRVLMRFEPWMSLAFSEGSIGGDIERVRISDMEEFYGNAPLETLSMNGAGDPVSLARLVEEDDPILEPTGSNGFAIAPPNTVNGDALLLINPHTSFYFRAEVHMQSDEGLNAYGAVTWGQFFIYQGFNERVGWMHTSSRADNIDEYLVTVIEKEDGLYYMHDGQEKPLSSKTVTISYKDGAQMKSKDFTIYRSHHGPISGSVDGKWVAFRIMEEPLKALQQSYLRTKAMNYEQFHESMEFHTNSSNNTVYADADGTIAYFHSNFIPLRNPDFDYSGLIDGSTSQTDWNGVHSIEESILIKDPSNGWIQNTNNWPFSATGANSPKKSDFPGYMSQNTENARGLHALRVLDGVTDFTVETLRDAAYDSYLTAFESLIPGLLSAYDQMPDDDLLKSAVSEQIEVLRDWDYRFGVDSVPTSVAIFWATAFNGQARSAASDLGISYDEFVEQVRMPEVWLEAVDDARQKLEEDFGVWNTPWGEINRFQRLTGDIVQPFDDSQPSIPVGFTSATWGSLAAYGQRTYNGTRKVYGTRGNSFVAIVEFGERLRAIAITAGGQSGDPTNPHFNDQAERYASGDLREVYFYPEDLAPVTERTYHPGE